MNEIQKIEFGVRRQSAAATALWIFTDEAKSDPFRKRTCPPAATPLNRFAKNSFRVPS
jgi:hypothetical protein